MEDFIYWTFETRHSDGFTYRFAVHEHEDGAMQITRISPYDETEYHWDSKSAGRAVWRIIRDGRTVSRAGATGQELVPEEVAHLMLDADQKAHLIAAPAAATDTVPKSRRRYTHETVHQRQPRGATRPTRSATP